MDHYYDYSAFISYKREDEKWAIWLQNQLEHYSLPSAIRKEIPRLPKRLKPIFRDKTDLGAGGLSSSLRKELERSNFLIVICSPKSAKSDWVGVEIEHFKSLGREDKIIPFIVEGEPHSENINNECYHPIFRQFEDEPLGISVSEIGKQQALIKVLAKILDLRFDILWDRHKRYKRKKIITTSVIIFIFFILSTICWVYARPTYRYYADYVDKWGIPEGIIELTSDVYKHRARSYRFEYRRIPFWRKVATDQEWRLTKVEYVNSYGQLQDHSDSEHNTRFAIQELEYDNTIGTIKNINFCNKSGKILLRWKVSNRNNERASIIDFLGVTNMDASGYHTTNHEVNNFTNLARSKSTSPIKRYVLTRDTLGYITSISYHENNSYNTRLSRTTDINGIHKIVFSNDNRGRIITRTYYDLNEEITSGKDGIAIEKYEYDKWGNTRKYECFDTSGHYVLNNQLFASYTLESDEWGNTIKEKFYGTDNRLCYTINKVAQRIIEYDKNGYPLSILFLDDKGNPCISKNGYVKVHIKCDKRGNEIENWFEGISGNLSPNIFGNARLYQEYDRWGRPTYTAYFSLDGNLKKTNFGIAGCNIKYDHVGNITHIDYFDPNWNVCVNNFGFASWNAKYNDRGDQTDLVFYDKKNAIVSCNLGYASVKGSFLENSSTYSFYGKDRKPCITKCGYHKCIFYYDYYGNILEHQYYNCNNELCVNSDGYAVCKETHDNFGNTIKKEFFDQSGNYTKNKYGVKIINFEVDNKGRLMGARFYDEFGNPSCNNYGISGFDNKYDSRGNQIEFLSYDINGKISGGISSVARWEKKYDARGNQLSYSAYDSIGNLCADNSGVASWEKTYNDRGLCIRTQYYDKNKKLSINKKLGYACYEVKYDDNLNVIEMCTYDENMDLCIDPKYGYAKWVAFYDDFGNKIAMESYATKDSLCVSKFGYARCVSKYDKNGEFIESISYDENGNNITATVDKKINHHPEPEVRKYDSHRFKYEIWELLSGFFLLAVTIYFVILFLKDMFKSTIKDNLSLAIGIIGFLGYVYVLLRKPLLHYSLIPYDIYNYSWIFYIISGLCIIIFIVYFLFLFTSSIILIFRSPKYKRLKVLKESLIKIIMLMAGTALLAFYTYCILNDAWIVYSNPL